MQVEGEAGANQAGGSGPCERWLVRDWHMPVQEWHTHTGMVYGRGKAEEGRPLLGCTVLLPCMGVPGCHRMGVPGCHRMGVTGCCQRGKALCHFTGVAPRCHTGLRTVSPYGGDLVLAQGSWMVPP